MNSQCIPHLSSSFLLFLHIFKTTSNALFKKYKLSRGSSTLTTKVLATAQDSLLRNVCFP